MHERVRNYAPERFLSMINTSSIIVVEPLAGLYILISRDPFPH